MKIKKLLCISVLFLLSFTVFSQSSNEFVSRIMYVNAKEGLRVRSGSSINSTVIGTLQHGEFVRVLSRSNIQSTINGITNYWYNIHFSVGSDGYSGWIFGGYLSTELPEDLPVVIGRWDDVNNKEEYYIFGRDFSYSNGIKESGVGFGGTWTINGTVVTIRLTRVGTAGDKINETVNVNVNIINRNNIELNFGNKIVRLKRDIYGYGM
jgi:hypothetical protein